MGQKSITMSRKPDSVPKIQHISVEDDGEGVTEKEQHNVNKMHSITRKVVHCCNS